jgi:hyaluronan synthase
LFLKYGFESLFCPDSAVETDSPIDWKTFLNQQLRWNKSWIRENILTLRFIQRLSKYDQFDIIYQQSFPFAMLYILLNIVSKGVGVGLESGPIAGAQVIAPYIYTIILYNELFSGVYGMLTNEMDPKFLLSPAYIDYHFGALLWLKIRAFAERNDTTWGTKGEKSVEEMMNIFQQNKGEIILEIHKEVVAEIKNPNFKPEEHKPLEVDFAE